MLHRLSRHGFLYRTAWQEIMLREAAGSGNHRLAASKRRTAGGHAPRNQAAIEAGDTRSSPLSAYAGRPKRAERSVLTRPSWGHGGEPDARPARLSANGVCRCRTCRRISARLSKQGLRRPRSSRQRWKISWTASSTRSVGTTCLPNGWTGRALRCPLRTRRSETRKLAWRENSGSAGKLNRSHRPRGNRHARFFQKNGLFARS